MCLQCTHIPCNITGIEKYALDCSRNQTGGAEETPHTDKEEWDKGIAAGIQSSGLEQLKHTFGSWWQQCPGF